MYKFDTNTKTIGNVKYAFFNLNDVIIDLDFLLKQHACLPPELMIKLEPRIEEGVPLHEIITNKKIFVFHRLWVFWYSLPVTVQNIYKDRIILNYDHFRNELLIQTGMRGDLYFKHENCTAEEYLEYYVQKINEKMEAFLTNEYFELQWIGTNGIALMGEL